LTNVRLNCDELRLGRALPPRVPRRWGRIAAGKETLTDSGPLLLARLMASDGQVGCVPSVESPCDDDQREDDEEVVARRMPRFPRAVRHSWRVLAVPVYNPAEF
jgi:hypothetical protein